MTQLNVAIWQQSIDADAMTNARRIQADTASLRDTLVCLPEMYLGRWNRDVADNQQAVALASLHQAARANSLTFLGSALQLDEHGPHNTMTRVHAHAVTPLYHKIHLFRSLGEDKRYRAGEQAVTIDVGGVRIGLAICYDLRFARLFEILRAHEAQMVVVAARWPVDRIHHWRALAQARAIEFQMYVCAVNCLGSDTIDQTHVQYPGNSLLVGPWGDVLLDPREQTGLSTATIDTQEVDRVRQRLNVWLDRTDIDTCLHK